MITIEAAVQVTAKYSVKDAEILTEDLKNDLEVVKDLEEGDLIRVDNESEEDEKAYSVVAQWNWKLGNYFVKFYSLLRIEILNICRSGEMIYLIRPSKPLVFIFLILQLNL